MRHKHQHQKFLLLLTGLYRHFGFADVRRGVHPSVSLVKPVRTPADPEEKGECRKGEPPMISTIKAVGMGSNSLGDPSKFKGLQELIFLSSLTFAQEI
jgi:hypothetical protein